MGLLIAVRLVGRGRGPRYKEDPKRRTRREQPTRDAPVHAHRTPQLGSQGQRGQQLGGDRAAQLPRLAQAVP